VADMNKMREEFEAWIREDSTLPLDRDAYGYSDFTTALMWHAWQAAREALAGQPAQGEAVAWYDGNTFYANTESASMCCADMSKLRPVYYAPPAPVVPRPIQRWPFAESPGEFAQRLRDAMVFFGDALPAIRNVVIENPPTLSRDYLWHLTVAAPEPKP